MKSKSLALAVVTLTLIGCGRHYHLPGHNQSNLNHPPDVTLTVGQRVRAVSTRYVMFVMPPAEMTTSDPAIVAVDMPDQHNLDEAYLVAKSAGKATVKYSSGVDSDKPNEGFEVTVVPAN